MSNRMAAFSTDPFMDSVPAINIVKITADPAEQTSDVEVKLEGFKGRMNRVAWTDLDETLISAGEDGVLRRWSVEVWLWKPPKPGSIVSLLPIFLMLLPIWMQHQ